MTIEEFRKEHKLALDYLLDDTWLCKEPISVEETKAWWKFMSDKKYSDYAFEKVQIEDFESTFNITFEELTNWWNKEILKVV